VDADDGTVGVRDVDGAAAAAGVRQAVADPAAVEPGQQLIEIAPGTDGEAGRCWPTPCPEPCSTEHRS
jgi:hypothetical protein